MRSRRLLLLTAGAAALTIASAASSSKRVLAQGAPFSVVEKSIPALQEEMKSGRVTSVQLVDAYLARIRQFDKAGPRINAVIAINPKAHEIAAALDRERREKGPRGILHGIPVLVKDNYATEDMPTTGGSKALEGFETGRDAFVVARLRAAGAVILGKTNLHELAYGITSVSSMGGQTRNPYDPARNPGGSSGGTGAAVAASFAAAGLGTDTCGSVRNPSSANALVGLRGSMGLSSRTGILPLSLTQDIGGPLARSITDLAIMLDATVGVDPADPVTEASNGQIPRTYLGAIGDRDIRDIRIGILTPFFGSAPEDAEVATIVRDALHTFADFGADVVEITIPDLDEALRGTSVINDEFKSDLDEFLKQYPGAPVHSLAEIVASGKYDPAVEGVLKRANGVASRDTESYQVALDRREAARQLVIAAMAQRGVSALAYPTLRRKPAVIGQPQAGSNCQLSATTGLPALAIPAGFTADGLPVGMELLGMPFGERTLLRAAYAYEQVISPRRPPSTTP